MNRSYHASEPSNDRAVAAIRSDRSLQYLLWCCWTLAVVGAAVHAALLHTHAWLLVLVVHCFTVGALGLVVLTAIEVWLQPERFC